MKDKNFLNKKILLGLISVLLLFAIIIVTSFWPFILDPTRWMTKEFLTHELIIVAIVVFSMVSVMFIGQAGNAANPKSEIAKAKNKFTEIISKIVNINAFFQWVRQVLQPEDIKQIQEREMRKAGIENYNLINLDIPEIKALIDTPQKYGDTFYKSITKKQAEVLIYLKTKQKIYLVQPTYYLTCKTIDTDKTITEKSGNESKKKTSILTVSVISKIVMTVIIAMIFTSFVYDEANQEIPSPAAWATFISRISALVSSSFMGYLTGSQMNDIDADYIEMRILVLQKYLDDKDFKPLSEQEEAKQEFIDRVKEENVLCLTGGENNGTRE